MITKIFKKLMTPISNNTLGAMLNVISIVVISSLVLFLLLFALSEFTDNDFITTVAGIDFLALLAATSLCLCFAIVFSVKIFIIAFKRDGAIKILGMQALIFIFIYIVMTLFHWVINKNLQLIDLLPRALAVTLFLFMYKEIYRLVKHLKMKSNNENIPIVENEILFFSNKKKAKKIRVPLICICVFAAIIPLIFILNYIPIKYAISIDEAEKKIRYTNYVICEPGSQPIFGWSSYSELNTNQNRGIGIMVKGDSPEKYLSAKTFDFNEYETDNQFLLQGDIYNYIERKDTTSVFADMNVKEWQLISPINRDTWWSDFAPEGYLTVYDYDWVKIIQQFSFFYYILLLGISSIVFGRLNKRFKIRQKFQNNENKPFKIMVISVGLISLISLIIIGIYSSSLEPTVQFILENISGIIMLFIIFIASPFMTQFDEKVESDGRADND